MALPIPAMVSVGTDLAALDGDNSRQGSDIKRERKILTLITAGLLSACLALLVNIRARAASLYDEHNRPIDVPAHERHLPAGQMYGGVLFPHELQAIFSLFWVSLLATAVVLPVLPLVISFNWGSTLIAGICLTDALALLAGCFMATYVVVGSSAEAAIVFGTNEHFGRAVLGILWATALLASGAAAIQCYIKYTWVRKEEEDVGDKETNSESTLEHSANCAARCSWFWT